MSIALARPMLVLRRVARQALHAGLTAGVRMRMGLSRIEMGWRFGK